MRTRRRIIKIVYMELKIILYYYSKIRFYKQLNYSRKRLRKPFIIQTTWHGLFCERFTSTNNYYGRKRLKKTIYYSNAMASFLKESLLYTIITYSRKLLKKTIYHSNDMTWPLFLKDSLLQTIIIAGSV